MHDERPPDAGDLRATEAAALRRERYELLARLDDGLEAPMVVLAFVWLALLVLEFIRGESALFAVFGTVIWVIFILDFVVKLVLAPDRGDYVRSQWLTVISLMIPALRIFRIARALRVLRLARAGRGLRLIRVFSSVNRGMRALGASLSRRGFGYVIALTAVVTFAGAAGMFAFENEMPGAPRSYGAALWWTAMIMTTMGSEYWPQTVEGRVLCVFLALYAFAVFGYVTATLATFFVGRDAESGGAEVAGARELAALRGEVGELRREIRALLAQTPER